MQTFMFLIKLLMITVPFMFKSSLTAKMSRNRFSDSIKIISKYPVGRVIIDVFRNQIMSADSGRSDGMGSAKDMASDRVWRGVSLSFNCCSYPEIVWVLIILL